MTNEETMNDTPLPHADLLITGATVYTCVPGAPDAGKLENAAIVTSEDHIVAVGPAKELAQRFDPRNTIDARGKLVTPGFVDPHTHVVFGGSRGREYAAKCSMTPEQVQSLGIPTGILATVDMTREASEEELLESAAARLDGMFAAGTTTVESKTGYGLTVDDEMKMLAVNATLEEEHPVDIVSTFLGGHAFPSEVSPDAYMDLLVKTMIPQAAQAGAEFCDVFCEAGYFSAEQSRRVLQAGVGVGLRPKIHTDEYADIGGSVLAAQLGAVTADHLNFTPREVMDQLAEANVIGVLMPALDFAVAHTRPFDAAAMRQAGMRIALATDICPGCWCESMQIVMQLACRNYGFTPEQALLASTIDAAAAIDRDSDRGSLEEGKLADLLILDIPTLDDLVYRIGNNAVAAVIRRGDMYAAQ
jgi:imidazolonepropionase